MLHSGVMFKKGNAALTPNGLTTHLLLTNTNTGIMNNFYKAVVSSLNLFCLLFIVFQLIYGRCIPSHTRPWICPPSTTPVCMFCFCLFCFVSTFHLDIEHMDQRHWGWWSHRGEIENKGSVNLICLQWPSHVFRIFSFYDLFFVFVCFFGDTFYILICNFFHVVNE